MVSAPDILWAEIYTLRAKLAEIRDYDKGSAYGEGICRYGCDCPSIAGDALKVSHLWERGLSDNPKHPQYMASKAPELADALHDLLGQVEQGGEYHGIVANSDTAKAAKANAHELLTLVGVLPLKRP